MILLLRTAIFLCLGKLLLHMYVRRTKCVRQLQILNSHLSHLAHNLVKIPSSLENKLILNGIMQVFKKNFNFIWRSAKKFIF